MPHRSNYPLKFDLEERTTEFARKVIHLCKKLPRGPINDRIINQLVGSICILVSCILFLESILKINIIL